MIFVNGRNFTKKELQQRLAKMNISYEHDTRQKDYYIQLYNKAVQDENKRKHIVDDSNKHFKFKRERTFAPKERDTIVKNENIEIIKQKEQKKKYVDYKTLMYLGSVVLASKRNEIGELIGKGKELGLQKEKIMAYVKVSCVQMGIRFRNIMEVVGKWVEDVVEGGLNGKRDILVGVVVVGFVVLFCGVMLYKVIRRTCNRKTNE